MNTMRNIALMAMGSALTLAYQKYNKPMMKAVKNTFNKAANGANWAERASIDIGLYFDETW